MRTVSLRAVFLIGFVIAMPILALPAVARRLDDWLYGPPPAGFSQPSERAPLPKGLEPYAAERASPASYDEIEPLEVAAARQPGEGLDATLTGPPLLSPLPTFQPLVSPPATPPTSPPATPTIDSEPLSESAVQRLTQIRDRLEELGAEYLVLETVEGAGQYRFRCDMQIAPASPLTREFSATAADPLAAAESVLAEIADWRNTSKQAELSPMPTTVRR
ncbi:MAG: hypothetical protein MUF06_09150 [Pirellulaceae bacterium]|jgi:hypothetical protein|nr:hypothetical protein [Pirellulaceae bacterium]